MSRCREDNPSMMSQVIAKEIGRRGFPAEARPIAVGSTTGDVQRSAIVIPGRGLVVIDSDLSIVVASSNKLDLPALKFECESVEAAAENILRYLPLP